LTFDAHSDILVDVVRKRAVGRKKVIEEDWVPKMRQGGIDTRVVVIYIDEAFLPEMALRMGLDFVAALHSEVDESPSMCLCVVGEDFRKARENGKIGFILGFEGVEPLLKDVNLLQIFYKLGLRVLSLTHSRRNYAGDGSSFSPQKSGKLGGLTEFGIDLVLKANELGIVVDVSHLNDAGFWDVIENTKSPIIASHSNCRSLCDHPRNLTDDQIRAIAEKEGVVGINSAPAFVDKKNADVNHFLNHVDHIVSMTSAKNVGLGFDFSEYLLKYLSGEERARWLPENLSFPRSNDIMKDEDAPNVINGLIERGYSERDIGLISGQNFLRVFQKVWKNQVVQ
jgi:membrane dipeptidase